LQRFIKNKNKKMKVKLAFFLIILATLSRFLPFPPNFSPIAAIGLFGAAYFGKKWMALALPLAALFLSDLVLNNVVYAQYFKSFAWVTSLWLYVGFAAVIAVGMLQLREQKISALKVLGASLTASLLFFLISNFSVWLESGMYPKTAEGLVACFTAAIPFFGNTMMGDLFFSGVMFGTYEYVTRKNLTIA
jgi:hypothetical protein